MNHIKQLFYQWIHLKIQLEQIAKIPPISEGEVWWCSIGKNVGVEINGKHSTFSRPVIIYKKLSRYGFLAIPLSTQLHQGSWYAPFTFQGKKQVAVLSQIRVISVFRLSDRMGILSKGDFTKIQAAFSKLYTIKNTPLPNGSGNE